MTISAQNNWQNINISLHSRIHKLQKQTWINWAVYRHTCIQILNVDLISLFNFLISIWYLIFFNCKCSRKPLTFQVFTAKFIFKYVHYKLWPAVDFTLSFVSFMPIVINYTRYNFVIFLSFHHYSVVLPFCHRHGKFILRYPINVSNLFDILTFF